MTTLEDATYQSVLEDQVMFERARREARRIVDAEERPPVEFPQGSTLRDLLAKPPDPVAWRIEGWWPAGGRVVLAAQAKAGKTTLALNLVRSLVDGAAWLGQGGVTPISGRVAVLDFEMTERQLVEWYRRTGVTNDDRVVVLPLRGKAGAFDLRDDAVRARWAELLIEHDVEFVVWDCLRPVMDALGLDENHDAGLLLTNFDALLAEAGGLEALIVHHTGHDGSRARGDSRIIGWGDANWLMVSDNQQRFLSAYGRDVNQAEAQLQLDPVTNVLTVVGGSRHVARRSAAMDAIVSWLTEAGEPLTASQIELRGKETGQPRAAVREGLASLIALHQIQVEQGPGRSLLHRLNPLTAESPESANHAAAHSPAGVPPPYKAAQRQTDSVRDQTLASLTGEMSEEQRALLAQLAPATDREASS